MSHPLTIRNNENYVSIIIPHFNRPKYLPLIFESLDKFADLPYELLIHEDGSIDNSLDELLKYKDKISTLLINTNKGYNVGLALSIDRLVDVSTSEYIIFMNNDCRLNRPCLNEIVDILKNEFVGIICLFEDNPKSVSEYLCTTKGTKFYLKRGLGHGSAIAFRKSFFNNIGKTAEVNSGCSDTPIFYRAFRYGYFRAGLLGERAIENISFVNYGNSDSCMSFSGKDCCFPKLFKINNYEELWRARENWCHNVNNNAVNKQDASDSNLGYWHEYTKTLFRDQDNITTIDWDFGKKHGQDKWKSMILSMLEVQK